MASCRLVRTSRSIRSARRTVGLRTHSMRRHHPSPNREFHSLRFVHLAATDEEAARHIETSRWNGRVAAALRRNDDCVTKGYATAVSNPSEPDDDEWAKRLVFGSPETVVEILRSLDRAGISHVMCHFDFASMDQADILDLDGAVRRRRDARVRLRSTYRRPWTTNPARHVRAGFVKRSRDVIGGCRSGLGNRHLPVELPGFHPRPRRRPIPPR